MALKLLQPGKDPIGQYDGYDLDYLTIKGGEVGRIMGVPYAFPGSTDMGAYDVYDGKSGSPAVRPVVTKNLAGCRGEETYRPLFLLDEGTTGYGVMLGQVVGGVIGQVITSTNLGPHTATGSGKVTIWDKPGLYAATLDSISTELAALPNIVPGAALYANTAGQLTHLEANAFDTARTVGGTVVGRFFDFSTNGSMVTTPSYLAGGGARVPTQVVFHFSVEG